MLLRRLLSTRLPLILICALGFGLRVHGLDAQPIWFDEGISVDLALAPPGYVIDTIDRPPLYYLLLHGWIRLAGASPFTFRFFSAWWGTLALVFFYLLARLVFDRRPAIGALGLAALAPFYVYYAQEARTYSLTLALGLASSWALLVWLKEGRPRWLILHAAAMLACLYTHYAALLLPIAQAAFVLPMALRARERFRWWLAAQAIAGLLFLPWPLHARQGLPELIAPQAEPSLLNSLQHGTLFVWTTLVEFSAGRTLAWPFGEAIALLFSFLVVLGVLAPPALYGEARALPRRFLLVLLALPPPLLWLLPRSAVYYSPKYLIVVTPAFYLLAIAGLTTLRREMPRLFVMCALLVLAALALGLIAR